MKKLKIFMMMALVVSLLPSCGEVDCDHVKKPGSDPDRDFTEDIFGIWYEEAENEEVRFNQNGTFYGKYCNVKFSGETEGNWEYNPTAKRLTERFTYLGQHLQYDYVVEEITDTRLVIKSDQHGMHTYERVITTLNLQVGETKAIEMGNYSVFKPMLFTSSNDRLASVDENGVITAEGEKGTTYIKIQTTSGYNLWAKVVVGGDYLDLWYDYHKLIGKTYKEMTDLLGNPDINGDDGWTFGYLTPLSSYITEIDIWLDPKTSKIDEIALSLQKSLPEAKLLDYLDSHYYVAPEIGDNLYYTSVDVVKSIAVVSLEKAVDSSSQSSLHFIVTSPFEIPDFSFLFGGTRDQIIAELGEPLLEEADYLAYSTLYTTYNYYTHFITFYLTEAKLRLIMLDFFDDVSNDAIMGYYKAKYVYAGSVTSSPYQEKFWDAESLDIANLQIQYYPDTKKASYFDVPFYTGRTVSRTTWNEKYESEFNW